MLLEHAVCQITTLAKVARFESYDDILNDISVDI